MDCERDLKTHAPHPPPPVPFHICFLISGISFKTESHQIKIASLICLYIFLEISTNKKSQFEELWEKRQAFKNYEKKIPFKRPLQPIIVEFNTFAAQVEFCRHLEE